jgi:hypothetical protein
VGDGKGMMRGEAVWGCWFLFSLCVFGCIFVILEEVVCVRDCRTLGLCNVGIVGWSAGDECV